MIDPFYNKKIFYEKKTQELNSWLLQKEINKTSILIC